MKRLTFWLYVILCVTIILGGFVEIIRYQWASLGMSLLALVFMSLPFLIEKRWDIQFPRIFLSVFILFLYASIFLGTANHFYDRFWWWDKMLHSLSGLIFADLGYIIAMYLQRREKSNAELSRRVTALFAFCFSVASEAVWEIYEYSMDKTFGTRYQGIGIDDTMTDIICDTIGALIFALFLLYQKRRKVKLIAKD